MNRIEAPSAPSMLRRSSTTARTLAKSATRLTSARASDEHDVEVAAQHDRLALVRHVAVNRVVERAEQVRVQPAKQRPVRRADDDAQPQEPDEVGAARREERGRADGTPARQPIEDTAREEHPQRDVGRRGDGE